MKIVVRFKTEIEFEISESWMKGAPISQVVDDVKRAAQGRLTELFQPGVAHMTKTQFLGVTLVPDEKGDL